MDVHLRELRYFVTVAEHLHFTRAAEELFVSQPALSKQIRALEAQLRVRLFERDRHEVRLTPAGETLLPAARQLLDVWRGAEAGLAAVAARQAATLVVGMSTGLGRGLLPAVRARFAAAAPSARLQVRQVSWEDPTGGVGTDGPGRTDAAFVWLPVPQPERYGRLVVASEPRVLALPPGHRLAGQDRIAFGDLLDEPFLALPASSAALRDHWLATDARDGRPAVIGAEVATSEETVEALLAGLGVCLVAAGNVPQICRDGITVRPVTGIAPSEMALLWRHDDERPLVRTLRTAVEQALTAG
ncbi:LysR family transcriptional regulator [Actinoplanes aureus]|uniref:LysR family transcriptional regulator n=1 Tax=Actinoplanes aureus TaxID=2792083 RepID=A0A931CE11_9ACTN|nr:LysR family transcriptional regulator [Actinoplanes aureus]MBG0565566.1 LysR family transcriptional regulator [Actinoplanes aureus]